MRLGILTLAVFATLSALRPATFLSAAHFQSLAFQLPELALLSLAMMLSMLTGGIDLSVVATANLSGILAALVLTRLAPAGAAAVSIPVALLAALGCGAACGALNGWLISRVRISPILATLGTLQLYTGLALVVTGGRAVHGYPEPFLALGNGSILGVPVPFIIFAAAAAAIELLTRWTAFGISLRLIGTNPVAAVFSGIRVRSVLQRTYVATGLIAGLTGILMIARTNSARADYGSSYLLQSILVAVLGGVHPAGGFGSVAGVSLAVVALGLLASGFNMLQFSNFAKEFTWGLFLLAVMTLNHLGAVRRSKGRPETPETATR